MLPEKLPADPKPLWSVPIGEGYAGPIVVGKRVIAFHREAADERLEAFDRASGKSIWKANLPATYREGIDNDRGPRCVPVSVGDAIYVFGAAGNLAKVQLADGKIAWQRDLAGDYKAQEGYFGFGSTPILIDGTLLVNIGGKSGIVGIDPATGKTKWEATTDEASYSSPTAMKVGDKNMAVFITRLNLHAVDPTTGEAKLLIPFGKRGPTVNAAAPLAVDGKVFVTASYNVGAALVDLSKSEPRKLWGDDDTLSSQYTTPVLVKGYLYGTHGREDAGESEYRCIDAATGKVKWSEPNWPVAHTLVVGDTLLAVGSNGQLRVLAASSERYTEQAKISLAASPANTRAIPAFSDGVLFYRTNSGRGGKLVALPLK